MTINRNFQHGCYNKSDQMLLNMAFKWIPKTINEIKHNSLPQGGWLAECLVSKVWLK